MRFAFQTERCRRNFGASWRSDITLRAKQPGRPHIIIEFNQGENIEHLASEAMEQIKRQQYATGLTGEVVLMGIAHYKKQCEVSYEVLQV